MLTFHSSHHYVRALPIFYYFYQLTRGILADPPTMGGSTETLPLGKWAPNGVLGIGLGLWFQPTTLVSRSHF